MLILVIAATSIGLQFLAAFLALRLIPLTGVRFAWVLISAGLCLMGVRRLFTFVNLATDDLYNPLTVTEELITFSISLLMLLGILRIRPLFESIKRSADALQESERNYRTIFENCMDAIFVSTKEGIFLDVNQAALDFLGYTREEMIGMEVLRIYSNPKDRDRFQEAIKKTLGVRDFPIVFVCKDGTEMDCRLTSTVLLDADNRVFGYQGIIRDVSEPIRLMRLVENERRKFISVLEGLPAFIDLRTPEYGIVFANRCFRDTFGDPEDRPCHLVLRGSDQPCTACRAGEVFETGRPLEFEWNNSNGRTYKVHQYPFTDAEGVQLMLEMGIDITAMKQAEADRTKLAAAIEQATEGILILDGEKRIQYVNHAFTRINGCESPQLVGRCLDEMACDLHSLLFHQGVEVCLSAGTIWKGKLTSQKKKGLRVFEVETSISPVHGADGTINHCVVVERDVTNEARLERQLRQSQKMEAMGTLAGGIAHDFNNILSIIYGYTDLSLLDTSLGDKTRLHIGNIKTAAHRARELVAQILAFSRQGELQRRPIQIGPIVDEILKLLRASLPTSIKIIQHNTSERMVFADSTQISQIVMNLCTNAAHAMGEVGGVLELLIVDVDLDDDFVVRYPHVFPGPYIQLTVSDTGHGMDQATLERIFEPYFTTKGHGEGTGLGLSVVHGIVESHGGMITVYSEAGQGTVFNVLFPQFQDTHMSLTLPNLQSTSLSPGGTEHILFVDDEVSLVAASLGLLENLGYSVTTRSSSTEALEAFRANPERYDLVISDLTMPQMGGIELARELRRIRPDLAIIICTGFSGVVTPGQLKAAGVSKLLAKPIIFGSLARTVREVLDGAKLIEHEMVAIP